MSRGFMLQFALLLSGVAAVNGQNEGCAGCLVQRQPAAIGCGGGMPCQPGLGYAPSYQFAQRQPFLGQPCSAYGACAGGSSCQNGICACQPGYSQTLTDCIPAAGAYNGGGLQALIQQPNFIGGPSQILPAGGGMPCVYQPGGCAALLNAGAQTIGGGAAGASTFQGQPCVYQNGAGCGPITARTNLQAARGKVIRTSKLARSRR